MESRPDLTPDLNGAVRRVAKGASFSFGICISLLASPAGLVAGDAVFELRERVSAHPEDLDARRELGFALVQLATEGSATAASEARAEFDLVLAAQPGDALARVNRGLSIVLEARDAPLTQKRNIAGRGFAEMDRAVEQAPGDPEVRLVRAVNAYQMPLMLGRAEIAENDFQWLLEISAGMVGPADAGLKRRIYFHAGSFALKENNPGAVELLKEASLFEGDRPSEDQLQTMLALAHGKFRPNSDAQTKEQDEGAPSRP